MPDQSSEPDRYTIDEMMERLKGRDLSENPEGELVIRSDGSQAMKVKKRRRRTNQAVDKETKRNQRIQIVQIAGFVVLIVVAGLVAGIGMLYANSVSFRDGLTAKSEEASGAKAEFKRFRMNPATANLSGLGLEWPSGNILHSLSLTGLAAKVSPASFLGKAFQGEEVTAVNGELILKAPVAGERVRHVPKPAGLLPVRFNRYSVPLLDIYFGGERNPGNMLEKTEGSLFPSNVPGQAEIRFTGGTMKLRGWPTLELDRSYMKATDLNLEIKSLRFTIANTAKKQTAGRGFIDFSGKVQPLDAGATHVLAARLESFPLSYVLGLDLGHFFLGKVQNREDPESNFLKIDPGSEGNVVLDLSVVNTVDSKIDVSSFIFLSLLANALQDNWYGLPSFDEEVSLKIRREGPLVEMNGINLVSRGKMALRGQLSSAEGGQIKGVLRLGLPATTIASTENKSLDAMFGEVREAYRWVDLEIGGTGAAPSDNFLALYKEAGKRVDARSVESESANDSFESLTDPE